MYPLEALADAIMQFEGWKMYSRSWRNRNPGNLRPYDPSQPRDSDGYRVFDTLDLGWAALKSDLQSKFNGSHGLNENSTLLDLLGVYAPVGDQNNPSEYAKFVCQWTSKALNRTITLNITLAEYNQ